MGSGSPLCLLGFGQCRKYYHKEHLFLLLLLEPQMWGGYRCYMHLCPGIQTAFILQRSHFHTLKTTTKGRETPLWLVALSDNWNMLLLIKMWFSCTPENDSPFPHLPTPTLTLTHTDPDYIHTDLITPILTLTHTDLITPTLTLTWLQPHWPWLHPHWMTHTDLITPTLTLTHTHLPTSKLTNHQHPPCTQWSAQQNSNAPEVLVNEAGQWAVKLGSEHCSWQCWPKHCKKQLRKHHQEKQLFSHNVVCTIKHSHPVSIASHWLTLYHQLTPQCLWKWTHCVG